VNGYLFLDKAKFRASFAADVSEAKAAFLADSQVPWGVNALSGSISEPAWRTKPSWYLVATEDRMIPPPAQRQMATRAGVFERLQRPTMVHQTRTENAPEFGSAFSPGVSEWR